MGGDEAGEVIVLQAVDGCTVWRLALYTVEGKMGAPKLPGRHMNGPIVEPLEETSRSPEEPVTPKIRIYKSEKLKRKYIYHCRRWIPHYIRAHIGTDQLEQRSIY